MILNILFHISIFRELIDYLNDKQLYSKKIIVVGDDTIECRVFCILLKCYQFQYLYCKKYDFFVKWFKNKCEERERFFYIIVDKQYGKWLRIINNSGEMTNFAVPFVR